MRYDLIGGMSLGVSFAFSTTSNSQEVNSLFLSAFMFVDLMKDLSYFHSTIPAYLLSLVSQSRVDPLNL